MGLKQYFVTVVIPVFAFVVILFTGCTTIGEAHYKQPLAKDSVVIATDAVKSEVISSSDVAMAKYEKERFAEVITSQIKSHAVQGQRAPRSYQVIVEVTRYEKGSAFARAMLAGLGQMHIDGTVSLLALPGKLKVGEFSLSKTFSWGGVYGASANIETVETDFAKAVAEAVTNTARN